MTLEDLKERGKNDVRRAYDAGYSLGTSQGGGGYDQGYTAGVEAGKKAQHDEFWGDYQDYGNAKTCNGAFAGVLWTIKTFKPNHDIKGFTSAMNLFWSNYMGGDLVEILSNLGRILDFSDATNVSSAFAYSKFTRLGIIDLSKATTAATVFANCSELATIDKIIVSQTTQINAWFHNDSALKNVTFEGVISQNGLDFKSCTKLSKASITSAMYAFSAAESLSATFSKQAVNTAFETSPGAGDGSTSAEWLALLDTRPNCTISLI